LNELREASKILRDDPKLYYSLAGRGEVRKDVVRFLKVLNVGRRHGLNPKESFESSPWLIEALNNTW
jgi:hypothetical protein